MLNKLRFVLANALVLLVCASAFGQNTKTVETGRTYVKLSGDLISVGGSWRYTRYCRSEQATWR